MDRLENVKVLLEYGVDIEGKDEVGGMCMGGVVVIGDIAVLVYHPLLG